MTGWVRRVVTWTAALTVFVVALTGCGPESGRIAEKAYEPAYTTQERDCPPGVSEYDDDGWRCTWDTVYHDEQYQFRLVNDDGWDPWVTVSQGEWEACAVGDYWARSGVEGCTAPRGE